MRSLSIVLMLYPGVIVNYNQNQLSEKLSSLTSKTYNLDQNVRVTVLLDSGDAHMHYSKRREPGNMITAEVFQSDLSPVENGRYGAKDEFYLLAVIY